MPTNCGFLRIYAPSPSSQLAQSQSEIVESLRRIFEIFPFLGDDGRRPGSIHTPWRTRQCKSVVIRVAARFRLWRELRRRSALCDRLAQGARRPTRRETAPSAIAKHRIHGEAAARVDRRRRLNMKESASVGGLYSLRFLLTLLMIGPIPILARHIR